MKVVLKVDINDEKIKQRAMKLVSSLAGVDSIGMDMKEKKLTVTGEIDPVTLVSKLRKLCQTEILTAGPIKMEQKKEDPKSGDWALAFKANALPYYPPQYQLPPMQPHYDRHIAEEDPYRCVIC